MANKSNSSVRFLGESMAPQSAFRFYLTFIHARKNQSISFEVSTSTVQQKVASWVGLNQNYSPLWSTNLMDLIDILVYIWHGKLSRTMDTQ